MAVVLFLYYTHHPKHTCARNPHQLLEFCGGTLGIRWSRRVQSFSGGVIVVVGRIGEVECGGWGGSQPWDSRAPA